jgi:hypothetical protein
MTATSVQYDTAAITAEAGIVRIHAHTIRPARPQRTAERRLVAPTPTIEPVIVCVVLTGIPQCVASWIAIAPPVSAANPPIGRSFVIRDPIVCTIRHPPNSVPSEIIEYAPISTQRGMVDMSAT